MNICGVVNKPVDKDYNLKTIEGKTKCILYLNTGLFYNLYKSVCHSDQRFGNKRGLNLTGVV